MASHVGRKTPKDWENSYFNLEQRFLALQKDHLKMEQERKLAAVAERKAASAKLRPSTAGSQSRGSGAIQPLDPNLFQFEQSAPAGSTASTATPSRHRHVSHAASSPFAPSRNHAATATTPQVREKLTQSPHREPSQHQPSQRGPQNLHQALQASVPFPSDAPHVELTDPRLVWGAEKTVEHMLQVNSLHQTTEQLRRKLEEADSLSKLQQHEVMNLRQVVNAGQARTDEITLQLHQAVRERDLAAQRLQVANHAVQQTEEAIKTQVAEKERLRSALEGQCQDLRSRLLVSADSNETMSRDIRALLSELKEKSSVTAGLQSRLTLSENNLTMQRNTNQSLLVELRSLNDQLVSERKRSLAISREVQVASAGQERVGELERQIDALVQQRSAMEREHLKMLEDFVRVSNEATTRARGDVQDELEHCRAVATHWERVSQMLYQDIVQRTASHVACREECDEAKRLHDEATLAVRALREELRLCNAKLNIVWPTHRTDTGDMDPQRITQAFQRLSGRWMPSASSRFGAVHASLGGGSAASPSDEYGFIQPPTQDEIIEELEQANAAMATELETLRISNELLSEQLRNQHETADCERRDAVARSRALEDQIEIGYNVLDRKENRVEFLEEQVRRLRGDAIAPQAPLDTLGDSDNVFELFIGQIIAPSSSSMASTSNPNNLPAGVDDFPAQFCTVDFLVHESVATKVLRGHSGFLDTTIAFRVSMDALLLHYILHRGIMVQLHRISERPGEVEHTTIAEGTYAVWELLQKSLDDNRPTLRGNIALYDISGSGHHVASVEFVLTVRAPFSQHFKKLVSSANFTEVILADPYPRWRRAQHEGDHSVSLDRVSSHMGSQATIGPSVSVPKVIVNATSNDSLVMLDSISVWIDVVKLNFNLDRVPQLSCFFTMSALGGREVYIAPAAVPSLEWRVAAVHTFPITSMREVFRLVREPLALFFFDEGDAERKQYWAVCATDLGPCLTQAGAPVSMSLTLTSYEGVKVGEVIVRVQAAAALSSSRQANTNSSNNVALLQQQQSTLDAELIQQQLSGPVVTAFPAEVKVARTIMAEAPRVAEDVLKQ